MFRKRPQFGGQNRQNLRFLEILKKRKMANFKSKNLCDKRLKIKNLRWQLYCFFCWLHRGLLRFFSRRGFQREICRWNRLFWDFSKKLKNGWSLRQNLPLTNDFLALSYHPSSWPVREICIGILSLFYCCCFHGYIHETNLSLSNLFKDTNNLIDVEDSVS